MSSKNRSRSAHLEDLVLIIKCLYPHREAINKYETQIMLQGWPQKQKESLLRLITALAILQQTHRPEDRWGRIYATDEDFATALFLMESQLQAAKPKLLLQRPERWFYSKIRDKYDDKPFTATQAQIVCRLSKTNTWWKLQELQTKGFVQKVGKKGQAILYKLAR